MKPDRTTYNEKELFLQIAEGDEQAFGKLFHLCLPKIHPIAFQVLKSEQAVKDVIQEVFLSCWLNRDKMPGIEEPVNWIFRITYNHCFRYLRNQALRQRTLSSAGLSSSQPFSRETEQAIDLGEVSKFIREAISGLPPQSKKIFSMSRTEGLKPAEIAERLGISVQSVRNSLTRSTSVIREQLAEKGLVIPLLVIALFLS